MTELTTRIQATRIYTEKQTIVTEIVHILSSEGYDIVEVDTARPWGAFIKISNTQADQFVKEFFPSISLTEAKMGIEGAELSPKILLFSPRQRISWQYHHYRAERWKFLSSGYYIRSESDEEGDIHSVVSGDEVQFKKGERHRGGAFDECALVAEIWQHIDLTQLSSEADIVRLSDDYKRN